RPPAAPHYPLERVGPRAKRQIIAQPHRLDPPAAAEVEAASRLVGEGGNGNAILKGDAAAADGFEAERRCQFSRGCRAGTVREEKPVEQRSKNQTGAVAGRTQRPERCLESVQQLLTFWTGSGQAEPTHADARAPAAAVR